LSKSSTATDEPSLTTPITDSADPSRLNVRTDIEDPSVANPSTEIAAPRREQLRSDSEDPTLATSMTDRENREPNLEIPKTDTEDPMRE
jgi:hypothetical protein